MLGEPIAFLQDGQGPMMATKPRQSHYIRAWREARNVTLRQLVDRLPFTEDGKPLKSIASLNRIENFEQPYSQEILEALAKALDVTVVDLIARSPDEQRDLLMSLTDLTEEQLEEVRRYTDFVRQR